jgi:hypothetical protein
MPQLRLPRPFPLRTTFAPQLLLLLWAAASGPPPARGETMEEITDRLLETYSKRTNPNMAVAFAGVGPDQCPADPAATNPVDAQIYVTKLSNIDQKTYSYSLEGFFRMWWTDPRLRFNGTADGGCVDKLVILDPSVLWTPDFYFPPSVEQEIGEKNDGYSIEVNPAGEVFWSQRLRITLNCEMNFERMPWDEQSCSVQVGPYSQTGDEQGEGDSGLRRLT